ncbi:MAG TPA: glycosyltransferase family 39 protein [Anaerolineales bacterium]|nr:glycosyltransferase family 39 protein [Anaerolineales bacterium]
MPIRNPQPEGAREAHNQQWALLALLLVSFAIRLHALLQLPGFVDEGNHLLWAAEVWQGRIIFPFSTAKPLEIFYLALLMPFRNPLWMGRFGSVLMSVVTLTGLWALARRLGNGNIGLWAAIFYAFTPWTFFHERTAVADPLLAAVVVLTMWGATVWVKRPSAQRSIGLAACLFALPLVKLSAAPFMVLPIVIVVLKNRSAWRGLWLPYFLAIGGVMVVLTPAMLRHDVFGELTIRATAGQTTSWIDFVLRNIGDVFEWSAVYLGLVGPMIVIGAALAVMRRSAVGLTALAGGLLGLSPMLFPATLFPRYDLPVLALGSLLAGEAVQLLLGLARPHPLRRSIDAVVFAAAALPFAAFAAQAYSDPSQLKLADIDRAQHVWEWSSGYGIREAAAYVAKLTSNNSQPAVVYSANLATHVIARLYWPSEANGETYLLWDSAALDVIDTVASGKPTYLIVDTSRDTASFEGLTINPHESARFERPSGGQPVVVYRLLNEPFQP